MGKITYPLKNPLFPPLNFSNSGILQRMFKKQIIFLEPWPAVMIYKIARMFKKKGYSTISIRILQNGEEADKFYADAFDEIISFNLNPLKLTPKNAHLILKMLLKSVKDIFRAIKSISKIKPYVIIGRAKPSWPCALVKILFKKYPFIYFPYDIRALDYEEENIGIPNFELKAEKYCFEKSEGIMHKGGPSELKYLNKSKLGNLNISPFQINFLPYCSEEFIIPINKEKLSKKDKQIHTVYIGALSDMSPQGYSLKYCEEFVKQKIHIHIYTTSDIASNTVIESLLESGYLHLHSILNPKEIIREISKYDFGLFIFPRIPKNHPEKKFEMGNKIASYLEAGIPIISLSYDYANTFADRLIKKYKIGKCLSLRDIKEIKKIMKSYKALEENIIKTRQDFLMEKHFFRLEKFVDKIVQKDKSI